MQQSNVETVQAILSKPVTMSDLYNAVGRATGSIEGSANATSEQPVRLDGMRLLVVDDHDINREVARRLFEGCGAAVTLAGDGAEAVQWLSEHAAEVDAVLMDVQMPIMGGYDATAIIRQRLGLRDLPVVALSAGVLNDQKQAAFEAGMNEFISKPTGGLRGRHERVHLQAHRHGGRHRCPAAAGPGQRWRRGHAAGARAGRGRRSGTD